MVFVKRSTKKLHALSRISKYIDSTMCRFKVNSFITLQFSYCSLICMFHSKAMECRVKGLREITLRFVYLDQSHLTFEKLLKKDEIISVQKNLQKLAIEIYKPKNKFHQSSYRKFFSLRVRYMTSG